MQLILGILFISISATVTPHSLRHVLLPTLGLAAVLVIAARPIAAFASTLGTDLARGERAFIGWMAPRGIAAAATASTFGAALAAQGKTGSTGSRHRCAATAWSLPTPAPRSCSGAGMTRSAVSRRYQDGARIVARRADGELPAGHDILFLLRADGQLAAVTEAGMPMPQAGDTIVSLGPAPAEDHLASPRTRVLDH